MSRSKDAFIEFLKYLGQKGLMSPVTALSRRVAANKILSILDEEECRDVTVLNLDDVMARFSNIQGKAFTPGSLRTYHSRLKSALDDFERYLQNPLTFRPSLLSKDRSISAEREPNNEVRKKIEFHSPKISESTPATLADSHQIPIPIRAGLTVFVQGVPFDLTATEAEKIANVIRALGVAV